MQDDIEKCIGAFGWYQFWIFILVSLIKFPMAMQSLSIIIQGSPIDYTCKDNNTEKCADNCTEYEYDRSFFTRTLITEWDLVCDDEYYLHLAQTITMLGVLFGNLLCGIASDKWGRRLPLVVCVIMQFIFGCLCSFIPWYWLYCIGRFLVAFATGGTMIGSFVVALEIMGIKWRTTMSIIFQIPFYLGHALLALVVYFFRDWRWMQICISVPSGFLVMYYWLLPESPRWLLANNQLDKAIAILEKIAKFNKLPTENIREVVTAYAAKKYQNKKQTGHIWDLVRTPFLRKVTFLVSFNWIVCSACFYGTAQYMSQRGTGIYLDILFSSLLATPGTIVCIWIIKLIGRKKTLMLGNGTCAIAMFIIAFAPITNKWIIRSLGCMGMIGMDISFPAIYVYTGELLPTVFRNAGMGFCSTCGRVGAMVAPLIIGLRLISHYLPPMIFGALALAGGLLYFFLPETLDCILPDTIEDAENFGKKKPKPPDGTGEGTS